MEGPGSKLYSTNVETKAIQYLFSDESTLGVRFREAVSILVPTDIISKLNDDPYRKFRSKEVVDQRLQYYLGQIRKKLGLILPKNWVLLLGSSEGERILISFLSGESVEQDSIDYVMTSFCLEDALKKFEMKRIRFNREITEGIRYGKNSKC